MVLSSLPQVPWHVRKKQIWLALWYEPNPKLTTDYLEISALKFFKKYPDEFFQSLNGIFNGTLSYRSDSFIAHPFYNGGLKYIESEFLTIDDGAWKDYKKNAVSKNK